MIGLPPSLPVTADVAARISAIEARVASLTAGFGAALSAAQPAAPADATLAPAWAGTAPGTGPQLASAALQPARTAGIWVGQLPPAGQALAGRIESAAREAGIDPALLAAVVRHESNFDQDVVSHAGAIGLAQLMPGTAAGLGVDPHDPDQNLRGGARYLRQQLDRFGAVDLALAAYNAGPNRVAQAGGVPQIRETQLYVERVLGTYQEWT